jgi:flagellin
MTLEAVDGRNIHVETSDAAAEAITGLKEDVYTGKIELESDAAFFVTSAIGAGDNGFGALGFNNAQVVAVNSAKSSVSQVDTLSRDSSNRAIQVIDRALEQISANRADLGALHNRLESTINNLSSISENIAASRGRILDADFAAESAQMAKTSILQQAGTSILAQANQAGQAALTLLG